MLVLRVRDELPSLRVHHPVEVLQRYLADDVRQCIGQLNDIEVSRASLNFQLHRRENSALLSAVGHCSRSDLAHRAKAQRLDDTALKIESRRTSVHQGLRLNLSGLAFRPLARDVAQVIVIRGFEGDRDFAHEEKIILMRYARQGAESLRSWNQNLENPEGKNGDRLICCESPKNYLINVSSTLSIGHSCTRLLASGI